MRGICARNGSLREYAVGFEWVAQFALEPNTHRVVVAKKRKRARALGATRAIIRPSQWPTPYLTIACKILR